jgi:hypothetical protein
MVGLVLQAAREQPGAAYDQWRPVRVGAADDSDIRSGAERIGAGQRKAALIALVQVPVGSRRQLEDGVADGALLDHLVRVGAAVDEDAEVDADLVGRKPGPVGGVHGDRQIGDQFEQLGVEVRDRLAAPMHDGFAPSDDRSYGSSTGQRAHVHSFRLARSEAARSKSSATIAGSGI